MERLPTEPLTVSVAVPMHPLAWLPIPTPLPDQVPCRALCSFEPVSSVLEDPQLANTEHRTQMPRKFFMLTPYRGYEDETGEARSLR